MMLTHDEMFVALSIGGGIREFALNGKWSSLVEPVCGTLGIGVMFTSTVFAKFLLVEDPLLVLVTEGHETPAVLRMAVPHLSWCSFVLVVRDERGTYCILDPEVIYGSTMGTIIIIIGRRLWLVWWNC